MTDRQKTILTWFMVIMLITTLVICISACKPTSPNPHKVPTRKPYSTIGICVLSSGQTYSIHGSECE